MISRSYYLNEIPKQEMVNYALTAYSRSPPSPSIDFFLCDSELKSKTKIIEQEI